MIALPTPPDRGALIGFGVGLALLAGALAGGAAALAGPAGLVLGLPLAAAVLLLAWRRPEALHGAYGLWNRAAGRAAALARGWVLGVCYVVVFAVVGRAGSRLALDPPAGGASTWCNPDATEVPEDPGPFDRGGSAGRGGFGALAALARRPSNRWALVLVPFLALIRVLDAADEPRLPSNIYTLY